MCRYDTDQPMARFFYERIVKEIYQICFLKLKDRHSGNKYDFVVKGWNMFQPNEYVVYGRLGVCRVEGIEQVDGRDYYCLRTLYQNCAIKTPVNGKIPVRRVISREQADALIDRIPSMRAEPINTGNARELSDSYRSAVLTQECKDLLELVMSIYAKKRSIQKAKKKLNSTDESYFKEGEKLLYGELAVALGIPYGEVQSYIRNRVKSVQKEKEQEQLHS